MRNVVEITPERKPDGPLDVRILLEKTVELNATDLHLTVDSPPVVRVDGELAMLKMPKLSDGDINAILDQLLDERQRRVLRERSSVDASYAYDNDTRWRVNVFYQRGRVAAALRQLPNLKLSINALGLPDSLHSFAELRDGLVLVTGPTGAGKSTTLAALIDKINHTKFCHIITVEDPIEFMHHNVKSLVTQREVFTDVPSFSEALRNALREDPDVILVGEMRDLDTMRTAIMAAETGHLVFSTLHSRDATSSLNRMIGMFPVEEQVQIRMQLSIVLRGVVSQRLLRSASEKGRCPCVEVMKVTPAVSNLIRTSKLEQIYSVIETGSKAGMQTMEYSLVQSYKAGMIDRETALRTAKSKEIILPRLEAIDD